MRWKPPLIATLVLILIAGFVYLYEIRGKREKVREEKAEHSLYQYDDDGIGSIELWCRGERVRLSLQEEGWKILKPVDYPADGEIVARVISSLRKARILTFIEEAEKLHQYNLSPAPITITITTKSGQRLPSLWIGDETPLKGEYFAMQEGRNKILVLSKEIALFQSVDLFALRDKRLLPFSRWDISEFRIIKRGKELRFKNRSGLWDMMEPMEFPADEARVASVLNALESTEVKKFIDDVSSLSRYGLETPSLSISYRGEKDYWYRIDFGDPEGEGSLHVKRNDRDPILVVDESSFEPAAGDAMDFMERKISKRNRYNVREFIISSDELTVKGTMGGDGEWADPDSGQKMDKGSVYMLLAAILEMKYADFIKRDADSERWIGSSRHLLQVTIKGDGFSEELACSKDPSGNAYLLNSSVTSVIFKISMEQIRSIQKSLLRF
ncbi:MAG: DUF4340 domain-containing protein [Acidobacteriota bacterium]